MNRNREPLPRPFFGLLLGSFINRLAGFVVIFLAVNLTQQRHLPVEFAGLVTGVLGVGQLLGGPLGGFLSDQVGRRQTLSGGLVFGALFILLLTLSYSKALILLAAFGVGLASLTRPAATATISDLVEKQNLQRAFRLLHWTLNLAGSVGAALAGYLAGTRFHLLGAMNAAAMVAYALIAWSFLPASAPRAAPQRRWHFHLPFLDQAFLKLFVLNCLMNLVFYQFMVAWPLDLNAHGISAKVYGYLFALNGVLIIFLQPTVGRRASTWRPSMALALASSFIGLGFGLNFFAGKLWIYVLSVLLWTLGEVMAAGVISSVVTRLSPSEKRGRYHGAMETSVAIPLFLSPLFGSFVLAHCGHKVLWTLCLLICLGVAIGYLVYADAFDKEPATLWADSAPKSA